MTHSHVCDWLSLVADYYESWHMWMSNDTFESAKLHMDESWHVWMSHGTYEWVMARMNESWHVWMSHGTYEWVMLHINHSCRVESVRQPRWHDSFTCVWLTFARGRLLHLLLYSDSCYWILLQLLARVKQFDAGRLSMTHSYVCVSHSYVCVSHSYVTRSRRWLLYLLLNWDLCLIYIGFTTE